MVCSWFWFHGLTMITMENPLHSLSGKRLWSTLENRITVISLAIYRLYKPMKLMTSKFVDVGGQRVMPPLEAYPVFIQNYPSIRAEKSKFCSIKAKWIKTAIPDDVGHLPVKIYTPSDMNLRFFYVFVVLRMWIPSKPIPFIERFQ